MKRILVHFTIQNKDWRSVDEMRGRLSCIRDTTLVEIIAAENSSQRYDIYETSNSYVVQREEPLVFISIYLPTCLHRIADQIGTLFQPFGNVTIIPILGFYPRQT